MRLRTPALRRDRDTRRTLGVAALGLLALLVAIAALVLRTGRWTWQPAIAGAALAHQLMWAAPVALLALLAVRRWLMAAVALAVLVIVVIVQAPLYVGGAVPDGRQLTVLQANLKVGAADPRALVSTVRREHVGLLMTEELTTSEQRRLVAAGLSGLLPHRYTAPLADGGGGLGIWSRFPLSRTVNHGGYSLGVLTAEARIGAHRSVDVVAVHLLPPYPYPSGEWLREIARLRPLLTSTADDGVPVVVAGDFNATTDNAQFRDLLVGYQDAAEHAGAGYLVSYPTDRWFGPVVAIDHVLTDRAAASSASTIALPGSDHRGLLVHLALDAASP